MVPAASHQSQIHSDPQVSSLIRLNVRGYRPFFLCVCGGVRGCGRVCVLLRDCAGLALCEKDSTLFHFFT